MGKKEHLTIDKISFSLEVPNREQFKRYADRISNVVKKSLTQKLERILEKHKIPNGTLVIQKIEVNLGIMDTYNFEKTIIKEVSDKIDKEIGKLADRVNRESKQKSLRKIENGKVIVRGAGYVFESELVQETTGKSKTTTSSSFTNLTPEQLQKLASTTSLLEQNAYLEGNEKEGKREKKASPVDLPGPDIKIADSVDMNAIEAFLRENIPEEFDKVDISTPKEKKKEQLAHLEDTAKEKSDLAKLIYDLKSGKAIEDIDVIPEDLPPKPLTELDRAFIYYLKYGRLPSNITYEIGTSMLDVFKVNQKDVRFFNEIKKRISSNSVAKERLVKLMDEKNKKSLIRKNVLQRADMSDFDPRIPKEFEDYFVSLLFDLDTEGFSEGTRRYNLNDMVRFFFTDHPQKLKTFLQFIIADFPVQYSTEERITKLYEKLGKASIVKIISSFVRKGGYVNKYLNQINKINNLSHKEAHSITLQALLEKKNPLDLFREKGLLFPEASTTYLVQTRMKSYFEKLGIKVSSYQAQKIADRIAEAYQEPQEKVIQYNPIVESILQENLSSDQISSVLSIINKDEKGFAQEVLSIFAEVHQYIFQGQTTPNIDRTPVEPVIIEPRVFLGVAPTYTSEEFSDVEMIDYYFTYGALSRLAKNAIKSPSNLSVIIMKTPKHDLAKIPYFEKKLFTSKFQYSTIGKLDIKAIDILIEALAPDKKSDLDTNHFYFKYNIKSGIPEAFQNAFKLYYALLENPKSYLEEMIRLWKKSTGDDDKVIRNRWKVTEELEKELNKIIFIRETKLEDQLKVDYEFQNYNKDISVKNAGLVIFWPFFKTYFNMLDLLDSSGNFRSMQERDRACHLLQFLAVKKSEGDEFYYPLNKILTGFPLEEPLSPGIQMTDKEKDVSTALLNNIVKQWSAVHGSSIDALRGSFIIRDGVLRATANGWLLVVEKKAYDILLDKMPWGIGMIKLSWAPYVLNVEWDRNIM